MLLIYAVLILSCIRHDASGKEITFKDEKHFKNVRQITFGGENVQAVFNPSGNEIAYQGAGEDPYGTRCDQIYKLDSHEAVQSQTAQRISSGIGLATRVHFFPDGHDMLYSSTSQSQDYKSDIHDCPMKICGTDARKWDHELDAICKAGHTWDLYPQYDIFQTNRFGNGVYQLTTTEGYNADADLSPDGEQVVFTSMRTGDPELFIMDSAGVSVKQLTNKLGYEGGATFSHDGKKIVFRAYRPETEKQIARYRKLLSYNLVSPLEMELFTMNLDGSNETQITNLTGSNLSPVFMKGDKRIMFASNHEAIGHCGVFSMYIIDVDGSNLERVSTSEDGFDAFPSFDAQQKRIVWTSSRNGTVHGETNVFMADWVDDGLDEKKPEVPVNGTVRS